MEAEKKRINLEKNILEEERSKLRHKIIELKRKKRELLARKESELKIAEYLKYHGPSTVNELHSNLHCSRRKISETCKNLHLKGILEMEILKHNKKRYSLKNS